MYMDKNHPPPPEVKKINTIWPFLSRPDIKTSTPGDLEISIVIDNSSAYINMNSA